MRLRLLLLALIGTLAGCDVKIRRGDLPEPPPQGWDRLGPHPAYTVQEIADAAEVDRLCRAAGVSKGDFGRGRFGACVDAKGKRVILRAGMDPEKDAATRAHEFPHTWGLTHGDRHRNWFRADGSPAGPLTEAQVQLMRSMAQAEARRNVFAQQPPAAPSGNIFRGR